MVLLRSVFRAQRKGVHDCSLPGKGTPRASDKRFVELPDDPMLGQHSIESEHFCQTQINRNVLSRVLPRKSGRKNVAQTFNIVKICGFDKHRGKGAGFFCACFTTLRDASSLPPVFEVPLSNLSRCIVSPEPISTTVVWGQVCRRPRPCS